MKARSLKQRAAETWDPQQHRFEVKIAIERVLRERRRPASEFPDATAGVVAVKETRTMGDDAIPITLARLTRIKRA